MRSLLIFPISLMICAPAFANDWEKFYTALAKVGEYPESSIPPEVVPSSGNLEVDVDAMWRKGFAPIGYSNFSSGNAKTKDAIKLAKKLKARHVILATNLSSSTSASIPLTMPSSTTSHTSGTASAYGSGGYASGSYSGTTTTYGSQTTYFPITVNRYDKFAAYFAEVPRKGIGIKWRDLDATEMARLETRRGTVVQSVRDGSPSYHADILPGDIILRVNGEPFDPEKWWPAVAEGKMLLSVDRSGKSREIEVTVPEEWR